jgi:hypothetical protein
LNKDHKEKINVANGDCVAAYGKGKILLDIYDKKQKKSIVEINDAL